MFGHSSSFGLVLVVMTELKPVRTRSSSVLCSPILETEVGSSLNALIFIMMKKTKTSDLYLASARDMDHMDL